MNRIIDYESYMPQVESVYLLIETEYCGQTHSIRTVTIHGAFLNPYAAEHEMRLMNSSISWGDGNSRRFEVRKIECQ